MAVLIDLPRIHFGYGAVQDIRQEMGALGVQRPLLVTDRGVVASGTCAIVQKALEGLTVVVYDDVVEPPTYAGVDAAAALWRAEHCDCVLAVGGGSVIDTAKMAALVASNGGGAADYAGQAERATADMPPLMVCPTTAGSGSEVSPSTGVHPTAGQPGMRTRSPKLVPRVTFCDPALTLTLPARGTACTGLDALTHNIEGYLSPVDNPLIDAMALRGIRRVIDHLETAVRDGNDRGARANMLMAALEGGISIGKGLGPAHALATAFSHWPVPHGLLAAWSLPPSLDLMQRHAPEKSRAIAEAMRLPAAVTAADGLRSLMRRLHADTGIPLHLSETGACGIDVDALAQASHASPVNHTSPYRPTLAEYRAMVVEVAG